MKRKLLLLIFLAANASLFGQFIPGDINGILDPIKQPLVFPRHGFELLSELGDSLITQYADGSDWVDSNRMDFRKNKRKDIVLFGYANAVGNQWVSEIQYKMNYKYNSSDDVIMFRRGLSMEDIIFINYFEYTYGTNGKIAESALTDSIYFGSMSMWFVTPGKETFSYNSSEQLTTRLLQKAGTGQTTLMNENKWEYKYDANGNCTEIIEYRWDSDNGIWEVNDRYTYGYNSTNLMTSAINEYWNGSAWEKYEESSFTYNGTELKRAEDFNYNVDENDDADDYYYNSDGTIDYIETQTKANGTSTWVNDRKSKFFYKDKEAQYALSYKWTGSSYDSKAFEKTIFRNEATTITKPLAPSNLTVSTNKKASAFLRLNWTDNSDNEKGFIISRSTDDITFVAIDSTEENVTEYIDSNVAENTKYYYKVSAYNGAGNSEYSNTVSETTLSSGLLENTALELQVYPNPCSDILTITCTEKIINTRIYSISGKTVMSDNSSQIDISALKNGAYILQIETENGFYTKPILKN